jgi:hypothetical protein
VSLDLQLRAVFAANPSARKDFQGLVRKWSGAAAASRSRRGSRASLAQDVGAPS